MKRPLTRLLALMLLLAAQQGVAGDCWENEANQWRGVFADRDGGFGMVGHSMAGDPARCAMKTGGYSRKSFS